MKSSRVQLAEPWQDPEFGRLCSGLSCFLHCSTQVASPSQTASVADVTEFVSGGRGLLVSYVLLAGLKLANHCCPMRCHDMVRPGRVARLVLNGVLCGVLSHEGGEEHAS